MMNENEQTDLNPQETSAEASAPQQQAQAAHQPSDNRGNRAPRGGGGGRGPGGPGGPGRGGDRGPRGGGGRGPGAAQDDAERNEWKEKVIQIRRVTKVVKGGKKLSFRAVVVVGNGKGEVGIGIGKSNEVIGAIQKAVAAAKKTLIKVPLHKTTIPHPVKTKAGGSVVTLLPASEGTGVIAGGAARALLELAGIENILSKSLGSNSPLNVARATLKCLAELRTFEQIARTRGKSVREILA
jgi:small subunit ribosomal protein S5